MEKNINICVLCMSCNQKIFEYQEMVARNTWIKHLKENNIDVFIFKSGNKNEIINDIIYCNCEDDVKHTYEKTLLALKQININNYDFIVRTNLSTYINAKMLIKYCNFLKENKYNIANGCLGIKDKLVIYRGNSLIMDNYVTNYFVNNKYENKDNLQDDSIFQYIFKDIDNLKIHSAPLRYYCKEGYFFNNPQTIKEITKENCEGIVFISYRITIQPFIQGDINLRFVEFGRCFEIDYIYNNLDNSILGDNYNIIFSLDQNKFIKGHQIIQHKSNK